MKIQLGQKEIEKAIRNYVREKIPGLPKDATVEIYTEHYGDTMCSSENFVRISSLMELWRTPASLRRNDIWLLMKNGPLN